MVSVIAASSAHHTFPSLEDGMGALNLNSNNNNLVEDKMSQSIENSVQKTSKDLDILDDEVFENLAPVSKDEESCSDLESLSSEECRSKPSVSDLRSICREDSVADSGLQSESDSSTTSYDSRTLSREDSTLSSAHSCEDSGTLSPDSNDSAASKSPRWVTLRCSLFSRHVDVVETQMFATFIDNKIVSQWQDPDQSVKVFDLRNNVKVNEDGEEEQQKAVYDRFKGMDEIGMLNLPIYRIFL